MGTVPEGQGDSSRGFNGYMGDSPHDFRRPSAAGAGRMTYCHLLSTMTSAATVRSGESAASPTGTPRVCDTDFWGDSPHDLQGWFMGTVPEDSRGFMETVPRVQLLTILWGQSP